ncbi:hypothetical protein FSP39_013654 [Pinctada imbricata]|uniref:GH16 domain-containing protein n=1 Tax=Pinctada imbricata TaxID=66713 RepID=A0AA88XIS1_PINIB|nr:hypothetical protein FSP39_013654 [Pinctada imbricata]
MIPPAMSSKVISKTSFRYGRVDIEAQMPIGDWLWTSIWLMPKDKVYGGWPRSGEIDITENRCNRNYGQYGIQRMMSTLHWGPAWNQDKWATTTNSNLSVDNEVVLNERTPPSGWWRKGGFSGNDIWTNSHAAPFDQEFFLQMNVAVGGTNGFFPDGVQNGGYSKPWSNNDPKAPEKFWAARHLWHPTWEGDKAAMKVRAVRIYQKVTGDVVDARGSCLVSFSDVPGILKSLNKQGIKVGIASRTSAEEEAKELIRLFDWDQYFQYRQIYPGNKTTHFKRIHSDSGIDYKDMIFFDDEHRNIVDVGKLGKELEYEIQLLTCSCRNRNFSIIFMTSLSEIWGI